MQPEQEDTAEVPIHGPQDVIAARRQGLQMASTLGFALTDATRIALVISELGRNIILYAGRGTITITAHLAAPRYLTIVARDQGPGIDDIDRALRGGYSTSGGLGLGLSGSKRLVDSFEVRSAVGQGTQVTATKWLRTR